MQTDASESRISPTWVRAIVRVALLLALAVSAFEVGCALAGHVAFGTTACIAIVATVALAVIVLRDWQRGEAVTQLEARLQETEARLARSEQRRLDAQQAARIASWTRTPSQGFESWSEQAPVILEIPIPRLRGPVENYLAFVHPEDRPMLAERYRAERGDAAPQGEQSVEYRFQRPNGETCWLRERSDSEFDGKGKLSRVIGSIQDISSEKHIEAALRNRETGFRYTNAVGKLGHWTWDRSENCHFYSSEISSILGVPGENLSGITNADYVERFVHPDDRDRMHDSYADEWSGMADGHLDYRIVWPDGTVRMVQELSEVTRDDDGQVIFEVGCLQDVTEQKRHEDRLRMRDAHLQQGLRLARMCHWTWEDGDPAATYSSNFCELFGLGDGDDVLMSDEALIERIVVPEDRDRVRDAMAENWRSNEPLDLEYRVRLAGGEVRHVREFSEVTHDAEGQTIFELGLIQDITQHKAIEAALKSARDDAERANAAKSSFMAAASHDLRQPLHGLRLLLTALEHATTGEARQQILTSMHHGIESMASVLSALLDISELEAGQIEPRFEPFRAGDLLGRLAGLATPWARDKDLSLRWVPSGAMIRSDPDLLARIVENFLANAVQYSEQGRILLGCRRRGDQLWIEVWDSGIGMAEADLAEIFLEFRQLDNVQRNRSKGLGLGLAIVERTARLLDHPIEVQSWEGQGSRFAVAVPLASPPAEALSDSHDNAGATNQGEDAGPVGSATTADRIALSVLLIEDDPDVLRASKLILEGWGAIVATAASAEEAKAWSRSRLTPPDVIIADYWLPNSGSGGALVADLQHHWDSPIPALIVTGDTSPATRDALGEKGLTVLYKPVDPGALRQALGTLANPDRSFAGAAPQKPRQTVDA